MPCGKEHHRLGQRHGQHISERDPIYSLPTGAVWDMEEMFNELYGKMKNMDTEMGHLKQENVKLKGKVDKLEEQSRRENLIFSGIPEKNRIGKRNVGRI